MVTKKSSAKKASAAKPSLSQLQKRLNDDTRLRSAFLKDPGGVLKKEGLELPPDKAQALANFTKQVTAPAKQVSIGSISAVRSGGAAAARTEVEVSVSVKVKF
jgi:hypothetical protein